MDFDMGLVDLATSMKQDSIAQVYALKTFKLALKTTKEQNDAMISAVNNIVTADHVDASV